MYSELAADSRKKKNPKNLAQTTVEYVIFMFVLVVAILALAKTFRDRVDGLKGVVASRIQKNFFEQGGMHRFFLSR